jgi:hypothetical protein
VVVYYVRDFRGFLIEVTVKRYDIDNIRQAPRRSRSNLICDMNDRYKAKRVGAAIDKFIINVLFDNLVCDDLDISVDLTCSLRCCTPETVLQLEPDQSFPVMWMPFRETE